LIAKAIFAGKHSAPSFCIYGLWLLVQVLKRVTNLGFFEAVSLKETLNITSFNRNKVKVLGIT
jgi:hypothetical protein